MSKTWGAEIWEAKNRHHDDVGVILGTGQSRKNLAKNSTRTMAVAARIWLNLLPPGAAILDVGCGPGARFTIPLSQKGFALTGLDASSEALRRAGENLARAGIRASLVQADLCDFKVAQKFDSVFCVETFFHLPAHLSLNAFSSFNRALKPGGYAFVQFAVQNELTPGFLAYALVYMTAYKILRPIFRRFGRKTFYVTVARHSEAEIHDIAARTGFQIAGVEGPYYVFKKLREI